MDNCTPRNLCNLARLKRSVEAWCFCPVHGMKRNSEVGVKNSDLTEMGNLVKHNSNFLIPKYISRCLYHFTFQYQKQGIYEASISKIASSTFEIPASV